MTSLELARCLRAAPWPERLAILRQARQWNKTRGPLELRFWRELLNGKTVWLESYERHEQLRRVRGFASRKFVLRWATTQVRQ